MVANAFIDLIDGQAQPFSLAIVRLRTQESQF